jgi:protein-S-isoprenylcysteine O-methyltransferase Ste14
VPESHLHVRPPLVYAGVFLIGLLLQLLLPLPRIARAYSPSLAGILALAGILLLIGSLRKFWSAGTHARHTRPTTAMVTSGPYRLTRNPMYVGVLCLYLAVACWLRQLWPVLLSPVVVWLLTTYVIRPEEAFLARQFGSDYEAYRGRVRRWV